MDAHFSKKKKNAVSCLFLVFFFFLLYLNNICENGEKRAK